MDIKYYEISKVKISDEVNTYDGCYLLRGNQNRDYDIELDGGSLMFNTEFKTVEVYETNRVNSLDDVLRFCERNNFDIPQSRITNEGLLIGGGMDLLLRNDLSAVWLDE